MIDDKPPNHTANAVFAVKARTSITGRGRRKGRMESMVHAAPVPVIEHVLHDIHTTGKYQGFPQLGGYQWRHLVYLV
jgi:hypothetical protein